MNWTNKHNLPETIVRWVEDQHQAPAKPETRTIRVSEAADSPVIAILKRRHDHEITKDVSEMIWALGGTAVHEMLGRYEKDTSALIEEDLVRTIDGLDGWKVTGHPDYLEEVSKGGSKDRALYDLHDYKYASVWAFLLGPKPEWTAQVNLYVWLYDAYGFTVADRYIVGFLRDWRQREAEGKPDYPQANVMVVKQTAWTLSYTEEWLFNRVRRFITLSEKTDEDLPPCAPEERWNRGDSWAVMKKGKGGKWNKRAHRVFDNRHDAEVLTAEDKDHFKVETRPGVDTRCIGIGYCDVSAWCPYWKAKYSDEATRGSAVGSTSGS